MESGADDPLLGLDLDLGISGELRSAFEDAFREAGVLRLEVGADALALEAGAGAGTLALGAGAGAGTLALGAGLGLALGVLTDPAISPVLRASVRLLFKNSFKDIPESVSSSLETAAIILPLLRPVLGL
jgi:hypothetical protein